MNCILVLGPRSCGTRYMTRILLSCGCWGSDENLQPLDALCSDFRILWPNGSTLSYEQSTRDVRFNLGKTAVLRRSLPHGNGWPNLTLLYHDLAKEGIYVKDALFMCRDAFSASRSMLTAGHENRLEIARNTITMAFRYASVFGSDLAPTFTPVIYKQLGDAGYVGQLVSSLGLVFNPACVADWRDEDKKYYEQRDI